MREMKDSGVEWIGEIPKDWKLERLQWHLDEIVEKNDPIVTTQVLSLTNKKGVIPYEEKGAQGNVAKESYDGYKIAYPNTIVANSMNILIGSVGYSNYYGCVSPVYYVFKEKDNNDLRFINYIMQTSQFQKELRRYANGILEIRLRVSSGNILKRFCAFPDYQEQSRIADYLDSKCSQIDDIIEKQQTIIEKLKEYKLSVITEAVTKGLNSDVDMVTCDAEWISEMPVNWMTAPVKKVTEFITCGVAATPEYTDESNGFLFLSAQNVKDGKMDYTVKRYIVPELHESLSKKRKPRRGDIVQVRVGATIGNVAVVDTDEPYSVYVSLTHMRTNEMVTSEFFKYALSNSMFQQKAMSFVDFAGSQGNLNVANMKKLKILVPPIEEQKNISDYLTKNCNSIDEMINRKNKIVEKLQEYKKSLIYEVVTGKKEV